MKQLSADVKHAILLEYVPRSSTHNFAALASRHAIAGGWRVVHRWFERWDGSAESLKRRSGGGRPRRLTRAQVRQYVRVPIIRANRAHRAVHYSTMLPEVRQRTEQARRSLCERCNDMAQRK